MKTCSILTLPAVKAQVAVLLFAAIVFAQPAFEVASVKLNVSGGRSSFIRRGEDTLVLQNQTLRDIVLMAYDLKNYALDAPGWLASRNFDINAKASAKATEGELRQMLQSLLAERFQMKAHPTPKDLQGYVLLPATGGLKVTASTDDRAYGVDLSRFPDKTRIACRHCTMDNFAGTLADVVGRVVVDQSGSTKEFSFVLEWSPNQDANDAGPSIFTALKEQLGIRLEARKVPVSMLVVDSIRQTPTEN
jgi:uncharacterized protein (TIGR03435 family)